MPPIGGRKHAPQIAPGGRPRRSKPARKRYGVGTTRGPQGLPTQGTSRQRPTRPPRKSKPKPRYTLPKKFETEQGRSPKPATKDKPARGKGKDYKLPSQFQTERGRETKAHETRSRKYFEREGQKKRAKRKEETSGIGDLLTDALKHSKIPGLAGPAEGFTKGVGRAAIEGREKFVVNTAKGGRDAITGIPPGLAAAAKDPGSLPGKIKDDYVKRYGPLIRGDSDAFVKRLKKEGAFAELLDASMVASAGGATVGRGLTKAAEKMPEGSRMKKTVTGPRPALRVGGNMVRQQQLSRNYFAAARQRKLDELRAKRQEGKGRVVGRGTRKRDAAGKQQPTIVAARDHNRTAKRVEQVAPISRRLAGRNRRFRAAQIKTRHAIAEAHDMRRTLKPVRKAQRKLSKPERKAYYFAVTGQLPANAAERLASGTLQRDEILRLLNKREDMIRAERELRGDRAGRRQPDELKTIAYLRDHVDEAFTANLQQTIRDIKPIDRRVAAEDPGINAPQAQYRRQSQRDRLHGFERGVLVDFDIDTPRQRAELDQRTREAMHERIAMIQASIDRVDAQAERIQQSNLPQARKDELLTRLLETRRMDQARVEKVQRELNELDSRAEVGSHAEDRHAKNEEILATLREEEAELQQQLETSQHGYRELAVNELDRETRDQLEADENALLERMDELDDDLTRLHQERNDAELAEDKDKMDELDAEINELESLRADVDAEHNRVAMELGKSDAPEMEMAFVEGLSRALDAKRQEIADAEEALKAADMDRTAAAVKEVPEMRYRTESDREFFERTDFEAKARGLEDPQYFASEKHLYDSGMSSALDAGARAAASPRHYEGRTYGIGRQDIRPEVQIRGLGRSLHRKHNWAMMKQQMEEGAYSVIHWTDDLGRHHQEHLEGAPLDAQRTWAINAGIDPEQVGWINPGRFESEFKNLRDPDADIDDPLDTQLEGDAAAIATALERATIKNMDEITPELAAQPGWRMVDADYLDEIRAQATPMTKKAKAWEQFKGKQSRLLLGSNPSWLAFQVASNALLTGFGVRGNVADLVKAQLWWRGLSDEQKAAIEPYLNTGRGHGDVDLIPGRKANSSFVNAWRAFKETSLGTALGKANPIEMMMKADHAQNAFFRRTVLYNAAKRDAYRRMNENASELVRLNDRLTNILKLDPDGQIDELIKNQENLERYAQHTNDLLGDYTTYTAAERATFKRYPMFYGFLRFSLRFTFYTMPAKHPLVSSIMGQLGRMQTEEVRELLGGDELPWALGKFYFSQDGKLKSIDVQRSNPALNQLVQLRGPNQVPGMLPPVVSALVDQAAAKNLFKDRGWKVEGKPEQFSPEASDYGLGTRERIFGEQMLRLIGYYRAASERYMTGAHGDDSSLLLGKRPTQYKRPDIVRSIERAKRTEDAEKGKILKQLIPFIPRPAERDVELAARIRENKKAREGRGKKKPARPSGGAGGWGGGGGGTGW